MQFRTIFAAATMALSANALSAQTDAYAGDKFFLVLQSKEAGGGGEFIVSDLPAAEHAALHLLPPPPEGVTSLIVEDGKPPRWSTAEAADIDKLLGGDGKFEIVSFDERFSHGLSEEVREIFPEQDNGDRQPIDGVWTGSLVSQDIVGCEPGYALEAAKSMVGASKQMSFSTPFHPTDFAAVLGEMSWSKASPHMWKAVITEEGMMPPGGTMRHHMSFEVVSSTEIIFVKDFEMKMPPEAARVLAMVGKVSHCKDHTVERYTLKIQ